MTGIHHPLLPRLVSRVALTCLLSTVAAGGFTAAQAQSTAAKATAPVTLNFVDADIEAVARAMAAITGRTVLVDPRVKGTLTLTTDTPVSPLMAYNQFLAALRLQGYTVVQSGGIDKVVLEADAKLQSDAVGAGGANTGSNMIVTQIFRLNFENPNNLVPVLRPLISPNNTINVNSSTNSLIITDYADNLQRIARIIGALDVSSASTVEVFPLRHALASDLAPLILRLADPSNTATPAAAGPGEAASQRLSLIAEPRSNALILRANTVAQVSLVKSLIEKLDRPTASENGESGNIWVVHLQNAEATKLAATLRAAIANDARGTSGASANAASSSSAVALGGAATTQTSSTSTGGQIQADPATNSIIITAPEPQYRQIRAVIDKLDTRRAQVFVESMIAEVNANKAAQFGIQWQGVTGQSGGTIGYLGTNFGSGGNNILNLNTQVNGTTLPGSGFNLGVGSLNSGAYVLGFLANLLETNGDGNVLSTPTLLTLDNEEAKIVVGRNVPFVTGQYSTTGTSATVTPFQTIERKDVGLTLRVKPQISENGTVRMTIYQEVSSIDASTTTTAGIVTDKRSIETNVLVEDGGIVVLGGLLQDQYSSTQEKVPFLGDIPFLGRLFRSETRTRNKTNLMVFLRPVVVRDAAASDALSRSRYDSMRSRQDEAKPSPSIVVPIPGDVQMPEAPATTPQAPKTDGKSESSSVPTPSP
jgi:general secretion pathway protein D